MNLLVTMITYNRLNYSKRTLEYFKDTISVPHYLMIVDNHSTDGTKEWIDGLLADKQIDMAIHNGENYYPGKATNIGWTAGIEFYPEATHLMRLDNDFVLMDGWDKEVERCFDKIKDLGQVGLDYAVMEIPEAEGHEITINGCTINPFPGNVGGTNVISRKVWDEGVRYDESKWDKMGENIPTPQEDCRLSQEISRRGYSFGHLTKRLAWTFADETNWKDYPEYYKQTFSERGYDNLLEKI